MEMESNLVQRSSSYSIRRFEVTKKNHVRNYIVGIWYLHIYRLPYLFPKYIRKIGLLTSKLIKNVCFIVSQGKRSTALGSGYLLVGHSPAYSTLTCCFTLLFFFLFPMDTFSSHLFIVSARRECSETPPKVVRNMFILFSLRKGRITKIYFNAFKCLMSADIADIYGIYKSISRVYKRIYSSKIIRGVELR